MTDTPLPPGSPADELVSAVLDGTATADERARVTADPALRARLAELTRARDVIATPVPVPAADRDAAIAAAVATLDTASAPTTGDGADHTGDVGVVHPHRRRNRALVALSVAAVAVLAVVVPLAVGRAARDRQDTAAMAPAPSTALTEAGNGTGDQQASREQQRGAPSAAAGAAPSTTVAPLPRATVAPDSPAVVAASFLGDDLGDVVDPGELRARVAARFLLRDDVHADDGGAAHGTEGDAGHGSDEQAPAAMPAPPPGTYLPPEAQPEVVARLQACDPQIRAREPGLGVVLFTASVAYEGVPALTFLYDGAPDAPNRLITVDRATCVTLDRQPSPR